MRTAQVQDPTKQVNRHGILHGLYTDFEERRIALKFLALIDSIGHVILHDKVIRNVLVPHQD